MSKAPPITAIIFAYNEALNIDNVTSLVERIATKVTVCDDGSSNTDWQNCQKVGSHCRKTREGLRLWGCTINGAAEARRTNLDMTVSPVIAPVLWMFIGAFREAHTSKD